MICRYLVRMDILGNVFNQGFLCIVSDMPIKDQCHFL